MRKGKFIVFEGGEGCGKTTQSKLLEEYLKYEGYKVLRTREPGGDSFSEKIRDLVKNPIYKGQIEDLTELLLYESARVQFVSRIIKPKLEEKYIVISDRYYDSTVAYQGYGNGMNLNAIKRLNDMASQGIKPDLTLIIDISAELGLKKMKNVEYNQADRMELKGLEYHKKVNKGYREIAKKNPARIKLIPYIENDIEEMQETIRYHVKKLLRKE